MTGDWSPVDRLGEIRARREALAFGPAADEFIAHAPADVGWLLEHIEQLQDEAGRFRERAEWWEAEAGRITAIDQQIRYPLIVELQVQRQAVLDLCDAADEADLKPAATDYEPIEVRWTLAVRAALGVDRD